ncbi:hypothetical protein DIPPA_35439 [Diplonema papillatum]|nr:hypothetical protein DIPPA_35439 [Diplonema papillatum]
MHSAASVTDRAKSRSNLLDRRVPAASPVLILVVLWTVLGVPLACIGCWFAFSTRKLSNASLALDGYLHYAFFVPLSLPVFVVLSYFSWIGRKYFVHN